MAVLAVGEERARINQGLLWPGSEFPPGQLYSDTGHRNTDVSGFLSNALQAMT